MGIRKITTNQINENKVLDENFDFYEMKKINFEKIEEYKKKKTKISFYEYKENTYCICEKDSDFKKMTGLKIFNKTTDFPYYIKINLFLRFLPFYNENYFIGGNNELNEKFDHDEKDEVISCYSYFVSTSNVLKINLLSYEKIENVKVSYGNKLKNINKKKKFSLKENILSEDNKKGVWINKRSKGYKKNESSVISSNEKTSYTKMRGLFNLNRNIEKKFGFELFEFKEREFKQIKKNLDNIEKPDILIELNSFVKKTKINFINKSTRTDCFDYFFDIYKNKQFFSREDFILKGEQRKENPTIIFIDSDKKRDDEVYLEAKKNYPCSQIIALSNLKSSNVENIFITCIKELIIKTNILNEKCSFFKFDYDFEMYSLKKDVNDIEYIVSIKSIDNNLSFEIIEDDFFSEDFSDNSMFEELNEKLKDNDSEMCLKIEDNEYYISKTEIATLPDFKDFHNGLSKNKQIKSERHDSDKIKKYIKKLEKDNKELLLKNQTKKIEKQINKNNDVIKTFKYILKDFKRNFTVEELTAYFGINKKNIDITIKAFNSELEKLLSVEVVYKYRSEDKGYFKNFKDLWINNNEYFSGNATSLRDEYKKLNYLMKVKGSPIDDKFISFVDSLYVKQFDYYNYPVPFKYINEYFKMKK
jgi:hypothetical protein